MTPRWKRAGPNGEIQATIGGKKYQIEKSLDHNERHRGEWKVMVWDKRRSSWEWETTEYGKANAKAWIMDRLKEESPATSIGNASVSLPPDAMFKPKIAIDRRRRKDKTPVLLERFRRHMEENG